MQTDGSCDSYSEFSQAASKWTWTDFVWFSATENQADFATQLLSKAMMSHLGSANCSWRTENMRGGASILPLPPLAESQRRSKEAGLFFSTLLTHRYNTPFSSTFVSLCSQRGKQRILFCLLTSQGERASKHGFQYIRQSTKASHGK